MSPITSEWQSKGRGIYEARLGASRFSFSLEREILPLPDLCDLAIRNNQKRGFLFVSRVLGRHWPTRPGAIRDVASRLVLNLQERISPVPTVFIGMAETATTLGQATYREFLRRGGSGLYLESTRRRTEGKAAFFFAEAHSHAPSHVIYSPSAERDPKQLLLKAEQVVIIDDEATTGRTASNLVDGIRAWRGAHGIPFAAYLAVILNWSNETRVGSQDIAGVASLVEGKFSFIPSEASRQPAPPTQKIDRFVLGREGARNGTIAPESLPPDWDIRATSDERILVVGNGEFGFQPLLLAEEFEKSGAKAWLQATTRSPIFHGGAISHVRSFPALSGEGYKEFLYNVPDDHQYDRVVLCTEDPPPNACHPIRNIPRLEVRL